MIHHRWCFFFRADEWRKWPRFNHQGAINLRKRDGWRSVVEGRMIFLMFRLGIKMRPKLMTILG